MRRFLILIIASAALIGGAAVVAGTASAADTQARTVGSPHSGQATTDLPFGRKCKRFMAVQTRYRLRTFNVTCSKGRELARLHRVGRVPSPWECSFQKGGGYCVNYEVVKRGKHPTVIYEPVSNP